MGVGLIIYISLFSRFPSRFLTKLFPLPFFSSLFPFHFFLKVYILAKTNFAKKKYSF